MNVIMITMLQSRESAALVSEKYLNLSSCYRHTILLFLLRNACAFPANTYMLKVNDKNTRKRREICLKLTRKTSQ